MIKTLYRRRSRLEQAVQATFGIYGKWNTLSVLILGTGWEKEKSFLIKKGVDAKDIHSSSFEDAESFLTEHHPSLLLIGLPHQQSQGSYQYFFEFLTKIRDLTRNTRVICVETQLLGYKSLQSYGDPELTIKQIYLELLKKLEEHLKNDYIKFHEKLLAENREENYEQRLSYLFSHDDVKKILKKDSSLLEYFIQAQLRILVQDHSAKSFESSFIAGQEDEAKKLQSLLKSKTSWQEFLKKFPKDTENKILFHQISESQSDLEEPSYRTQIWNELESLAGSFFDFHCSKHFNRMSGNERFQLTGDSKFEQTKQTSSTQESNIAPSFEHASSFKKFELDSNPLSSLMGSTLSPTSQATPLQLKKEEKFSLEEYGEIFISMLAAWHRQSVFVGGALFEYAYQDSQKDFTLGCIIALSADQNLMVQVNKLSEAIGLPKVAKSPKAKDILKAFFEFKKKYTSFYDKVRSQLKGHDDFLIGDITDEDYETEEKDEKAKQEKFQIDLEARKEKEKKQAARERNSHKARLEWLKELKESKQSREEFTKEEIELEEATIELDLSEQEIQELNDGLELKRIELEEKIELDRKEKSKLEEAIRREQEIRDDKRKEIELQRQRKKEAEKAERLKRQQRLQEERRKREEVKKMRAKNLRDAFDRAREAAIKKQESKLMAKTESPKQDKKALEKKGEKKKFNPEAVKMMIRFGTSDKKIQASTGIGPEDLEELKLQVSEEDQNL